MLIYFLIFFVIRLQCSTPPVIESWGDLVSSLNNFCTDLPKNRYCPLIKKAGPFIAPHPAAEEFVKRLHQLYSGDESKVIIKYIKKFAGEEMKNAYRPPKTDEEKKKEDKLYKEMTAKEKTKFDHKRNYGKILNELGSYIDGNVAKDYDAKYDYYARALVKAVVLSLRWMKEADDNESQVDFLTGMERFFDRFLMLHNDGKIKMKDDDLKIIKEMSAECDPCRPWYRRAYAVNIKVVSLLGMLLAIVLAYLIKSFFAKPSKK